MFRRFKGLLALFGVICVTAVAGGTAMFYFGGNARDEKTITNDSEEADGSGVFADNILENYEFGAKTDLNETYTYYFYPSTLYMSNEFFNANTNPEDIFGYNEVILDDNGNPVLVDGQPQYEIVTEGISGINANGTKYDTYYHYLKNYLNSQTDSFFMELLLSLIITIKIELGRLLHQAMFLLTVLVFKKIVIMAMIITCKELMFQLKTLI